MTQIQIVTTAMVTTVATLIFLAFAGWGLAAHAAAGDDAYRDRFAGGMHPRHGPGGPCGRWARGTGERFDRIAGRLDLDADQQAGLDSLQRVLEDQRTQAEALCADRTPPADALEAVSRMEAFMAHGLQTVQAARPAFEAFYVSLDEDQQAQVDRMMTRRPHRGGPRHWCDADEAAE